MSLALDQRHELLAEWDALCARLRPDGVPPAMQSLGASLLRHWQRWPRRYHDGRHLLACVRAAARHREALAQPGAVAWALWFHDAVYWPWKRDNEARSADWAHDAALRCGLGAGFADTVRALVMDTCHGVQPAPGDAAWLVDIDLGILGQSPETYARYAADVRREYFWIPRRRFAAGRQAVLRGFIARPSIYTTLDFRNRFEAQARANLAAEIERLQAAV